MNISIGNIISGFKGESSSAEVLSVPSGFNWTPPFSIYKNGNIYYSDFNPQSFDFTPSVTYYFNQDTGVDANDGLTPSTPKRNIRTVITALNAAIPSNGAAFILQTDYDDAFGFNNSTINFKLSLKSSSSTKRRLSRRVTNGTLALVSGNVYSYTRTSIREPLDLTWLNEIGKPKRFTSVASTAACQALPGSYFQQSGVIQFHPFDSRNPIGDANMFYQRSERLFTNTVSGLYCENIIFWGNDSTAISIDINNSTERIFTFNNCEFGYGINAFVANIGDSTTENLARIYFKNCDFYEALSDGINIHNFLEGGGTAISPYVLEENVRCYRNGKSWGGTSPNNNGSSMHDGGIVVRINGDYQYNENRQVQDVRGGTTPLSQSWMLKCIAGNAINQANNTDSVAYILGQNAGTQAVQWWMDGCTRAGGTIADLRVNTGSTCRTRNMNLTGWNNTINGTLTTY